MEPGEQVLTSDAGDELCQQVCSQPRMTLIVYRIEQFMRGLVMLKLI